MKTTTGTLLAVVIALAVTTVAPMANADSTQSNKNLWRNLAIGGAAVAGNGLLHHNTTETVIGVAGAAYSANRYEQERHSQSVERQREREAYYRHHEHYYYKNGVRHYYD